MAHLTSVTPSSGDQVPSWLPHSEGKHTQSGGEKDKHHVLGEVALTRGRGRGVSEWGQPALGRVPGQPMFQRHKTNSCYISKGACLFAYLLIIYLRRLFEKGSHYVVLQCLFGLPWNFFWYVNQAGLLSQRCVHLSGMGIQCVPAYSKGALN